MVTFQIFSDLGFSHTVNTHKKIRTSGLRTSEQNVATLISKNTRTCLAKQDQAGSYMWVTVKL